MDDVARKLDARIWDRDPDDFYIEPEWCSRRLFACETFRGSLVDPACGTGRICISALESGLHLVAGTDLRDRWANVTLRTKDGCSPTFCQQDFLDDQWGGANWWRKPTNIVCNPPFAKAVEFVTKALDRAQCKVAMLLPAKWMYGDKRSRWLATTPLYKVLAIAPRPSMPPGRVVLEGFSPGGGKEDFAWFIWIIGYDGAPETGWLWRDAP